MEVILLAVGLAILASVIYTVVGLIPGTDETASLAPLTLVLVLMGVPGPALLAWFIAAITAMETTNTVPAAIAAIPGSTMAVPFIPYCSSLRKMGLPHIAMRKLLAGSVIGTIVAIPVAVFMGQALAPIAGQAKAWAPLLFTVGAVIIALLSKSPWASLFSLIPLAFLIQGLQGIGKQATGKPIFICIFMGIAIGPMLSDQLMLLAPGFRDRLARKGPAKLALAPDTKYGKGIFPNPFKILTPKQTLLTIAFCIVASLTFTFSPVGMTVLLGGLVAVGIRELYHKQTTALSVMDGVTNATYIAETLIPLIAFGLPLSPMALGPAAPLFNAPPRFSVVPVNNLHNLLSGSQFLWFSILGALVAILISYPFCMNYAHKACRLAFTYVSHEALIGCFMGLVMVLAFYEAGLAGIAIALTIATVGGVLSNFFGVHIGVQFMAFYASSWIVPTLLKLSAN
jgi:putative tricarboxylic transport membrane protein